MLSKSYIPAAIGAATFILGAAAAYSQVSLKEHRLPPPPEEVRKASLPPETELAQRSTLENLSFTGQAREIRAIEREKLALARTASF